MKVLFLTRRFYPEIGGVEKHVLEISDQLISKGHQVLIIAEQDNDLKVEHEQAAQISSRKRLNYHSLAQSDTYPIITKYPVKSIQNDFFEPRKIIVLRINFGKDNFFKKFKIWHELVSFSKVFSSADIVHCHDIFFWYLPFRLLYPSKKVFTTFHGYETNFPPKFSAKVVRKVSEMLSFGNICVGRYIEKWYGTKADYITYGGVRIDKKRIKRDKTIDKKKRILFIGRLEEDNGVKTYLKALEILKRKKKKFSFVAVGDGKMRKKVEKLGRVIGFKEDYKKLLINSDIVFASSYLAILEALAYKKRVIATYDNRLKEDYLQMSPYAKFINIEADAASIAKIVFQAKANPKAYEWVKQQTWDKVLNMYLKLWQK